MNKTAFQIADVVLLKLSEYAEGMRKMVERIAKQYKQYGVKVPSSSELEALFKDFKLGQGSWQEHFQKSKWMLDANNAKMNFEAGHRGPAGTRGYRRSTGRRGYQSPFDADFWKRHMPDDDFWDDIHRKAKRHVDDMFPRHPRIGKVLGGLGIVGLLGLGAHGVHKYRQGQKLEDVKIPEDFSKRRRAGLETMLSNKSQALPGLVGGLALPAVAAGAMLHARGGGQVATSPLGLLGLVLLGRGGIAAGRATGKAVSSESNRKRLNAAIVEATSSGTEDKKLNRKIQETLGLRKNAV